MALEFVNYSKKMKRGDTLNLDFRVESKENMSIISNDEYILDVIDKSLRKEIKYKGTIEGLEKILFVENFGFYDHLTIEKNIKKLLKVFNSSVEDVVLQDQFEILAIDEKQKYGKISESEKYLIKILFLLLVKQEVIVINSYNTPLSKEDKFYLLDLLANYNFEDSSIIILDNEINTFSSYSQNVCVISDGEQTYTGSYTDLLVIKSLVAIEVSHQDDLDIVLVNYEYTIYNSEEIVVRENKLEEVLYKLLSNGIEVGSIRNLGEKIKLYSKEVR